MNKTYVTFQPLAGYSPEESGSALTGTIITTAGTTVAFKTKAGVTGGALIHEIAYKLPAGTVPVTILDAGAAGTALGTIATIASSTGAIGTATLASPYFVDSDRYVNFRVGAGTCLPGANNVTLLVEFGR